jgi:hypothetical protein
MFDNLTDRLGKTLQHIRGQARLTEDNVKGTLREVRMALLEADVALPVVKAFIEQVKDRAVGTEVSRSLSPGQVFVKIVQQELESIMGTANEDLDLAVQYFSVTSKSCFNNFPPEISFTDCPKIGSPIDLNACAKSLTGTSLGTRPATKCTSATFL